MCIGSTSSHWSVPFLMAVPCALLVAGVAYLVSVRFTDRHRARWIALAVGIVGWICMSVLFFAFTGTLQRC
jgi:peptidoglycan/LPS O-acetylase OafA/YrhL